MAETFTYDLISFLRVLYRKRVMIVSGTLAVGIITAIASLLWPQTWRAEANVLVSPPKYKETLSLVANPYDVLTYRRIMVSDGTIDEVLRTMRWGREAVQTLVTPPESDQLAEYHQDRALVLTPHQMIQNTNRDVLASMLVPDNDRDNPEYDIYLHAISQLGAEDLEALGGLDPYELEDLSIFDMRKMLSASTSTVKETNLETIYSPVIQVTAEFDTGERARMLANLWMLLFRYRAERMVEDLVESQILKFRTQAVRLEENLKEREREWKAYLQEADLESLYADLASKWILLKGVAPVYERFKQKENDFFLDSDQPQFMTENLQSYDTVQFELTDAYDDALLPRQRQSQIKLAAMQQRLEDAEGSAKADELRLAIAETRSDLKALVAEIKRLDSDIRKTLNEIINHESQLRLMHIPLERARTAVQMLEPLLAEANLLEQTADGRYADVSYRHAIKPDKRVFPKRSMMTALGLFAGFVLFCGLAFFQDIWAEVVKSEDA